MVIQSLIESEEVEEREIGWAYSFGFIYFCKSNMQRKQKNDKFIIIPLMIIEKLHWAIIGISKIRLDFLYERSSRRYLQERCFGIFG